MRLPPLSPLFLAVCLFLALFPSSALDCITTWTNLGVCYVQLAGMFYFAHLSKQTIGELSKNRTLFHVPCPVALCPSLLSPALLPMRTSVLLSLVRFAFHFCCEICLSLSAVCLCRRSMFLIGHSLPASISCLVLQHNSSIPSRSVCHQAWLGMLQVLGHPGLAFLAPCDAPDSFGLALLAAPRRRKCYGAAAARPQKSQWQRR